MRTAAGVLSLVLFTMLLASSQDGGAGAPDGVFLARVTDNALGYAAALPDFICTIVTRRTRAGSRSGKGPQPVDVIEEELSYAGRKESYRVLKVNNKPVSGRSHYKLKGFRSEGLFGDVLVWIFSPQAAAIFEPVGDSVLRGRPCRVFRFSVPLMRSKLKIGTKKGGGAAPFQGRVWADAEKAMLLRIDLSYELLIAGEMARGSIVLDYGPVRIGPEEYLLLTAAETEMDADGALSRNMISFANYRKYVSQSSIRFEAEAPVEPQPEQ